MHSLLQCVQYDHFYCDYYLLFLLLLFRSPAKLKESEGIKEVDGLDWLPTEEEGIDRQ